MPVVAAQETPSATRTFDDSTVGPGEDVEVSIAVSNYGSAGAVSEILPAGFTYKSSSLTNRGSGQEVNFILTRQESLTYVVTASSAAGTYTFNGSLAKARKRLSAATRRRHGSPATISLPSGARRESGSKAFASRPRSSGPRSTGSST